MEINKPIPDYLLEKGNIIRTIFLTAIFALIFINIYSPFNVDYWYDITDIQLFLYSSLIILTGVLVVVISRIIMYRYYKNGNVISYLNYGIWIFAEILSMALFYALYELFVLHDPRPFSHILLMSIRNTSLILLLAYAVIWLYLSWKDKKAKLESLSQVAFMPANRVVMISFKDERRTVGNSAIHVHEGFTWSER